MEQGGERDIEQGGQRFGAAVLPVMAMMARLCGWRPDEFWAATPAEVGAVLNGFSAEGPGGADGSGFCGREGLTAMMENFPDG